MKLTAIILLTASVMASAKGKSQGVSISMKDAPLEKVFKEIKRQTGYSFMYTGTMLKEAKKVSIDVKNYSLEQALDVCLANQPFSYTIIDKTIVLKPREATPNHTGVNPEPVSGSTPPPIDIKGRIVNENGEPLEGISVKIKGTNTGTSTNSNGEFVLNNVDEDAVLVFTGVNIEAFETRVAGRKEFALNAKTKVESLNEVVINKGYYTEKQKFSVSNVGRVTAKDIEKQPVNNPLLALQARVPGLVVTQNNGIPGGGVTVRIQGRNSIVFGNDPLYVVDGVPYFSQLPATNTGDNILGSSGGMTQSNSYGNPLSYINANDIESMEVLKDADATAIYGSRAANGAILITTKKGKSGQMRFDLNLQTGLGHVPNKWKMLNSRQYLDMRYEALRNDGINLATASSTSSRFSDLKVWDTTRYTDWQKELIGASSQITNLNASVSGGNNNMQYILSTTYRKETTVFPGKFNDERGSVHFNINNSSANQKFRVQISGSYMIDNNKLPGFDLTAKAVQLEPVAPALHKVDGSLNWAPNISGNSTWDNTLRELERKYKQKTRSLVSNLVLSYQIVPGLYIRSSLGYTNLLTKDILTTPLSYYRPEERPFVPRISQYGSRDMNSWIVEPQLTYKKAFGQSDLDLLVGATVQENNSQSGSIVASGFNSDEVMQTIDAANLIYSGGQYNVQYKYNALFGRINYRWKEKFIVNLTGRRDGTSRFGAKEQFHNFGSVGGAWIFSDEQWLKKFQMISFGKIRASYGSTGSDQVGDYTFMSLYNFVSTFGISYQGNVGIYPSGIANPYLQWEETRKLQIGIDLGFFSDKLILNATHGRNRSSNQLLSYQLPSITGFTSVSQNLPATVENTSWEFSASTTNIDNKSFRWTSNFNFTIPRNKLIAFPDLNTSPYAGQLFIDQPLDITKTYHFAGVDPNTGLYQFFDSIGKPTLSPNFFTDRTAFINTTPKFYGGIQNAFKFMGLEVDFLFQFIKQLGANYSFYNGSRTPGAFSPGQSNQPITVLNRWQKPNDITDMAKFTTRSNGYNGSTHSYANASFIRLKNLSISYQLPEKMQQVARLRNCKFYVQGQNLWTITNWEGLDPETQSLSLPTLRVLTVGLQVGF